MIDEICDEGVLLENGSFLSWDNLRGIMADLSKNPLPNQTWDGEEHVHSHPFKMASISFDLIAMRQRQYQVSGEEINGVSGGDS